MLTGGAGGAPRAGRYNLIRDAQLTALLAALAALEC
jgi:hypothetical protein